MQWEHLYVFKQENTKTDSIVKLAFDRNEGLQLFAFAENHYFLSSLM